MNIRLGISKYDPVMHFFIGPKGRKKVSPSMERCLMCLIAHRNKTVPMEIIGKAIWGNKGLKINVLYELIYQLRRILRADPNLHIDNQSGRGYGLKDATVKNNR